MKNKQQDLFTALLVALRAEFGADRVYDGVLPPEGAPYPFVYLADNHQVDSYGNKSRILGEVRQTIDVYSNNPKKRGTLSDYMDRITTAALRLAESKEYSWEVAASEQQVLPDNSTNVPLLHGIVYITFRNLGGTK